MKRKHFVTFAMLLSLVIFNSCEKDPVTTNGQEVITTINYVLTPTAGGTAVTLSFQDLDGDGGNAPTIIGGTLAANTTYNGALDVLNESVSPTESITTEILEEDEDHQFFFSTSINDLSIAYADQDADGNPVGLATTVTTKDAGSGTLTIILRHEPNKAAQNVAQGDISNAGGETDIEISFDIDVQ